MAPEVFIADQGYSEKADIFSAAVCMVSLRERVLYRHPTGPNPLYHLDDFSRPAFRDGSLNPFSRVSFIFCFFFFTLVRGPRRSLSLKLSDARVYVFSAAVCMVSLIFFFFFTLLSGPRRALGLKLSDTRVYAPQIQARLVTRAFCARLGCAPCPVRGSLLSDTM